MRGRGPSSARRVGLVALALVVGLASLSLLGPRETGAGLDDVDPALRRRLVEAMRAYLDPGQEFLWRPRKELLEAFEAVRDEAGIHATADMPFLLEVVYQGRHFQPRFSDRAWQQENDVTAFERTGSVYRSVVSETRRFTYTLPERYPTERALERFPRREPFPLLLALPDAADVEAGSHPGLAYLRRHFSRVAFSRLYARWLVLAPDAPETGFLEPDGRVRHEAATLPLTEFWRRYHVDFDRIVVDGREGAAALVATFPHVFAGLVLRGGEIELDLVPNYASVPVFVVGDEALAETLQGAGHADVTLGEPRALLAWLENRRRVVPSAFDWRLRASDQRYAYWVTLDAYDDAPAEPTLAVEVIDTEAEPNTIRIEAQGVQRLSLYLNDLHVDLDREVRLVVNGEEIWRRRFARSLDQLFAKDPFIRKNMNFGWLYPVEVREIEVPPAAAPPSRGPDPARRLAAQYDLLLGRPDRLEAHLLGGAARGGPIALEDADPVTWLPLAVRDLWWRRHPDDEAAAFYAALAERAGGVVRRQYDWLLGGGEGPYPHEADAESDPWPVLTTLVLDRQMREVTGRAHLPRASPLLTRPSPPEWTDWYPAYRDDFVAGLMREAYQGVPRAPEDAAWRAEERRAETLAARVRTRNVWAAVLVGLAFVGLVLVFGRRIRPA